MAYMERNSTGCLDGICDGSCDVIIFLLLDQVLKFFLELLLKVSI